MMSSLPGCDDASNPLRERSGIHTHLTRDGRSLQATDRPITAAALPFDPEKSVSSLYIHIPFCFHKCHYCDFYSIVDRDDRQPAFARRLREELATAADRLEGTLATVFVGGGTPTLLESRWWAGLLDDLAPRLDAETEFTVEANPETVTAELLQRLRDGGVNRLSIGAQSFNPRHLSTLERWHEPESVARAVGYARDAGFEDLSLDLIHAIPGQTVAEWEADLEAALALQPEHLSCYTLTFEPGTALDARRQAGTIAPIDDDLWLEQSELTVDRLAAEGFDRYEISNWCRPGRACRHNLIYWNNENWWPIGPAGAGHMDGFRWRNVPRLGSWLSGGPSAPIVDVEAPDPDRAAGESFMMGLRILRGMERARVEHLLSLGKRAAARRAEVERCIGERLLEWDDDRLRLTEDGLRLADRVVGALL